MFKKSKSDKIDVRQINDSVELFNKILRLLFFVLIVICVLMFFGRLGPITLFQIFQTNMDNEKNTHYREVQTDVIIG